MPVAGPVIASVAGAVVSNAMNKGGSSSSSPSSQTVRNEVDPRMAAMLYGTGRTLKEGAKSSGTDENGQPIYADSDYTAGTPGLLSRFQGYLDQPQNAGLAISNQASDNYVGKFSAYDFEQQRNSALNLMNNPLSSPHMLAAYSNYTNPMQAALSFAPNGYAAERAGTVTAAPAAQINAPSQNDLNLNPALRNIIYGEQGNNPYLAGAIQKGLNQSSASFQNLKDDMLSSFKQDLLPSIRGDAIVNGQYGGSRQGLAEGKAADSLTRNLTRTLSQVAQNQTDAAVQAQAQQYTQDRQNQLAAAMGLSGQQYGVSGANAAATNQVNLANAGMINQGNQFNANSINQSQQQAYQAMVNSFMQNAQLQQQANMTNYQGDQQMNLANLNNRQQANMQNGAWQLSTNQMNSQNMATGAGLLGGIQNNIFNQAMNANDAGINRAMKVNNLIAPYANLGSTQTTNATTPMYQNQGANLLGGALAGLNMYKQFSTANTPPSTGSTSQ